MSDTLTLMHVLDRWADVRPDRLAFRFLSADEAVADEVSYAGLRQRAGAIAHVVARHAAPGSRALLLADADAAFVSAFLGCLGAGVIAVPAEPPHGRRAWRGVDRIAVDSRPSVILVARAVRQRWSAPLDTMAAEHKCPVLAIEDLLDEAADTVEPWPAASPAPSDVAFLQYTSGSTSEPKGVMVTHANIAANVRMIQDAFGLDAASRPVSWLPLFHDMGLVGFVLAPLYAGCESTLLGPAAFLEKPVRWLRAIDRYRGTLTSGPNFAYDLCVSKVRPEEREGLDLSSLAGALNGSEPVSARTLARFREAYAPYGFRDDAFRPCYGMAETTLLISAVEPGRVARVLATPTVPDPGTDDAGAYGSRIEAAELVSCGIAAPGGTVRIINPITREECVDGTAGEVWFQGSNVAAGYWRHDIATAETFGATLNGHAGTWLRTGDLGCLDGGELFLMGRLKELLIVRGRNFVPRDIEAVVAASHEAIRDGHVVAAARRSGKDGHDGHDLAIVAEIEREQWRTFDPQAVVDAVLTAVRDEFAIGVASVTLLRPGGIPKTTSGKLKRIECARRVNGGATDAASDWHVLHEWRLPREQATPGAVVDVARLDALNPDALTDVILEWLRARLARDLGCTPDQIADEEPFARFGLDSAVAVTLTADLSSWLDLELSPTLFWEFAHPLALAEHLALQRSARTAAGERAVV